MDKSFDLTPLVDSLSNSFARRLGLNRRGFIHLLQACHFEEGRGRDRREYIGAVKESEFWEQMDRICGETQQEV